MITNAQKPANETPRKQHLNHDRPPVVLVPGSLCSNELFERVQLSQPVEVRTADICGYRSIEQMASAVLRTAPPRFVLVGLSLGGIVATEIWRQEPDRVLGLGLMDTNLAPPDAKQIKQRKLWAEMTLGNRFIEMVEEFHLPLMTLDRKRHDPAVRRMAHEVGPSSFLLQNEALCHRPDRRPILPTVTVPSIVACGVDDALCPVAFHEELQALMPNSELVVIHDAGHLSPLEQPHSVAAALDGLVARCASS